MVIVSTKMGPKGQILIPKIFREEYGFIPGEELQLIDTSEGLFVKKETYDIIASMKEIAKKAKAKKVNVDKIDLHKIYESELEERFNDVLGHKHIHKSVS
ncbi:AbrB/MazE/SpoVT family DNA-binding domain-containing protein [Candidatus Woesearchaeota archaeon]|nr:AbrB/MazE/SpoVT family DNA-binding domain-containing protein [Candidatus Woesearchaeota archaeon]